jgi:hypothetical protein
MQARANSPAILFSAGSKIVNLFGELGPQFSSFQ